MVLKQKYKENQSLYQEMVRKIAFFFANLEMEYHIVYHQKKKELESVLSKIYYNINERKECFIQQDETNFLFLRYKEQLEHPEIPKEVKPHNVPLPMVSLKNFEQAFDETDPKLGKIFNLINGENCVKKIVQDSGMEFDKVNTYLKNLLYFNMIKMVDMFQFSNSYRLLPSIQEFIHNDPLKNECLKYVLKGESGSESTDIVKLYMQLSNEESVAKFLINNKSKLSKINVLRFIHFGLINGFISRKHEYPIRTKDNTPTFFNNDNYHKLLKNGTEDEDSDSKDKAIANANQKINEMIQRGSCLDEICIELGITKSSFEDIATNKDVFCILM